MKFNYDNTREETRKPVAMVYMTHLIIRGDEGEAVYLCSDQATLDKVFVHHKETFDEILEDSVHVEKVFYKGDSVIITF